MISQYATTIPLVAGNEAPPSNDLLDEHLRHTFETHYHDSSQCNPPYNTGLLNTVLFQGNN